MQLSRKKLCQGVKSRLCGQCDKPTDKAVEPAKDESLPWEDGT